MRYILLTFLISASCDNLIRQAGSEAKKQCQAVLDDAIPKVEAAAWNECSTYFENIAIPELQKQIDSQAEKYLVQLGYVKAFDGSWDCKAVCR